jgi:putative serine protease PepD
VAGYANGMSARRPVPRLRVLLALLLSTVVAVALAACTSSGASAKGSTTTAASASSSQVGNTPRSSTGTASTTTGGPATALQQQYQQVIDSVLPSVVEITTKVGLGSGIVYDTKGDIVTNDHVVGTAQSFHVRFADQANAVPATLVGTFAQGDLAVIKVTGNTGALHPATFADSSKVNVGEIVLAMGNPLGLASSVTDGIVSAVGRTLTEPQSPDSPGATLPDSIQTSAAINPGNSGGALVDLQDQVIGIPTLAATDQQQGGAAPGIGFAIPSNTVKRIADQLVSSGTVTNSGRAALGVQVTTVTSSSGSPVGAGVAGVQNGSGAAAAGIQAGDVIVAVDGHAVQSAQQLSAVLATLQVGQHVTVTVVRNGTKQQVHATLGQLR